MAAGHMHARNVSARTNGDDDPAVMPGSTSFIRDNGSTPTPSPQTQLEELLRTMRTNTMISGPR